MSTKGRELLGDYWKFWKWRNLVTPMSKVIFLFTTITILRKSWKVIYTNTNSHTWKQRSQNTSKCYPYVVRKFFLEDVINNENQIFKTWFVDHSTGMTKRNSVHGIVEDNKMEWWAWYCGRQQNRMVSILL